MTKDKIKQSGFTLVEVAIAIAILGIGLMTLTALATRLMNDTQEEINRTRASFFSQYILEIVLADRFNTNTQSDASAQSSSGNLHQKLQAMNYFEGIDPNLYDYTKSWTYELKVESINLPIEVTSSYEKYSLSVTWGNSGDQVFHIETIKKAKNTGGTDESDGDEDEV